MWKKKEINYNLHHICPSSRWGITNDLNCEMIKETTHSAIHTLFSNMIFPEQIIKLTDLSAKALRPEIISELMEILQYRDIHDPNQWYKEDAIRIPKNTFKK